MTTAKSTPTADMNDIQRRMAEIRREMHEDVKDAVKGAQSLTDWRSQVKNHPWLAMSAAAAVGYMLVPRRRPQTPTIVTVNPAVAGMSVGSSAAASPTGPTRRSRFGLVSTAFSMLAPIAVRASQNYAIQYMEQWLAAQQGPTGPAHGPGPGSGQAGEHRPGRTTTGSDGGARPSATSGATGRPGDVR